MPTTNIHSDKRRKGKSHRGHQKKLKMEVRQDTNSEEVSDSSQSSEEGSGYSFMSPYSSNRSFSGCIWFPMFPTILSIDQYFNYGSYFPFYMYNYGIPYYESMCLSFLAPYDSEIVKLELSDDETEDCPSYDEYIPEMAPDSLPSPSISTNSLSTTTTTTETLSSTVPKASTVQPNYDLIWNDVYCYCLKNHVF